MILDFEIEQRRAVFRVVELVGVGLVDRRCDGMSLGVGFEAGVDGERLVFHGGSLEATLSKAECALRNGPTITENRGRTEVFNDGLPGAEWRQIRGRIEIPRAADYGRKSAAAAAPWPG